VALSPALMLKSLKLWNRLAPVVWPTVSGMVKLPEKDPVAPVEPSSVAPAQVSEAVLQQSSAPVQHASNLLAYLSSTMLTVPLQ
jgi:hypothetical protein